MASIARRIHWVSTMAPDLRQVFARIRPGPRRCMTIFYMICEQNWTNTSMYAYIYIYIIMAMFLNIYIYIISHTLIWCPILFGWRTELWRRPNLPGGSLRPVGRWFSSSLDWLKGKSSRETGWFSQETFGFSCKCSLNPAKWCEMGNEKSDKLWLTGNDLTWLNWPWWQDW